MPIYEYRCSRCEHEFEVWQKMSDPPVKVCPKCHAHKVEKLVSLSSFQLKGSGWYATDYGRRKSGGSGGHSRSSEAKSESSSSESTASGGEKSSDSGKGDKGGGEKSSDSGKGDKGGGEKANDKGGKAASGAGSGTRRLAAAAA